jgi:hypothetical protein
VGLGSPSAFLDQVAPEIRRSLELLHEPGTIFEIRGLGVPSGKYENVVSGYFNDIAKAAVEVARLGFRKPRGIYTTLNPCNPALLARANNRMVERPAATTADSEIIRRRWLFLDLDPERPSGIAATDDEVQSARDLALEIEDKLRARGWPVPLIAESGNGVYLLYRVDLPNDEASTEAIKKCYATINNLLGSRDPSKPHSTLDCGNFNAARIAVTIPDDEQDKQLPAKLVAEYPGILAWAVRGCLDWQQNGLRCPDEVKLATDEYRNEQDLLGEFIRECCSTSPGDSARAADLFEAFQKYTGSKTSQTKFGRALNERGFDKAKMGGVVWRIGIGLLHEDIDHTPQDS